MAWLIAEFLARPLFRRILGMAAILWSFGVAFFVGSLQDINANAHFTAATEKLLETSVKHLKAGHSEAVLREWSRITENFGATYESRGKYAELVEVATQGMEQP